MCNFGDFPRYSSNSGHKFRRNLGTLGKSCLILEPAVPRNGPPGSLMHQKSRKRPKGVPLNNHRADTSYIRLLQMSYFS